LSYEIFDLGLRMVDRELRDQITSEIGLNILRHFVETRGMPSIDKSDLVNANALQSLIDPLVQYFVDANYICSGAVYFGETNLGEFNWPGFDEKRWIEEGKGEFYYELRDAVILPSAKKLFEKYGTAQHYSSRTMEALLLSRGIEGREDPSFDPRQFSMDLVLEHWQLKRLQPRLLES
jgi:hypothetical protein